MMKKIVAKIQNLVVWLLLFAIIAFGWPGHALAAAGDGFLEYGSATVGEVGSKYRTWTEATTTWGGETAGPVTGPTVSWTVLKADPCNAGNYLLAFVENDGADGLNFYSWDGDSWQAELTNADQDDPLDNYRAFDIAFENSGSCNPVIVYGLTGDPDRVYYREGSWDGTDYNLGTATENFFDYTNQIDTTYNRWHILCPQLATSNMILLSVGDATTTRNIAARIYDGSSFGTESPDLGMAGWLNATAPTNWDFDCAWETSTAEGMVAWGVYNTANPYWKYITYTGGAWNAVTDGPNTGSIIGGAVRVLSLDGNPNSTGTYADDIAGGIIEATASDADGLIWDGSSWTQMTSIDTSAYGTVQG